MRDLLNKLKLLESAVIDTETFAVEETEVSSEIRDKIGAWIATFDTYIGGNGDTLPEGYLQWALNSGITTDFVETNEADAMIKKHGEDKFENDPMSFIDEMPITKACIDELEAITGNDDLEDNAKIIDQVMNSDGNESTNEDTNIDETYDDDDAFYEAYGELWYNEDEIIDEAEYQGRKVKLGKPMQGDVKKFKVYVKDPKTGNVKKVNFGHGGSSVKGKAMSIKKNNPKRRKSFRARHNCDNPGPRTKARYWSCRKW